VGIFDAFRPNAGLRIEASGLSTGWMPEPPRPAYTVTAADIAGIVGSWISTETAMQVPAFARGLSLICGVASGFPLRSYGAATPRLLQGSRMSTHATDASLISATVSDLVCRGRAAWKFDATRSHVRRLRPDVVQPVTSDVWADPDGWAVDGRVDPDILVFDNGSGCLDHGWPAIRTALALEQASSTIANSPLPSTVLKSTGIDLDDADAQSLLEAWERARRTRSTAYLSSAVDMQAVGWNASEMQLVEARAHAASEMARLLNLDGYWVGAQAAGSSLTYQNRQELNQSLLDLTVLPVLRVIEQGLSGFLSDGSTRHIVRFDVAAFTRAELAERVAALTAYVTAGILTIDEARAHEPLIREGVIPE
jgi:hypothetical protein